MWLKETGRRERRRREGRRKSKGGGAREEETFTIYARVSNPQATTVAYAAFFIHP